MTQQLTAEQLERIRDFVDALRSSEYVQAKNSLRGVKSSNGVIGYCCEGVAFARYAEQLGYHFNIDAEGCMTAYGKPIADDDHECLQFRSSAVAPPMFWHDMGVRNVDVYNGFAFELPAGCALFDEPGREFVEYAALNDAGFTFSQIADLIEWQFLSSVEVTDVAD